MLRSFSAIVFRAVGFVVVIIVVTPQLGRVSALWMHLPLQIFILLHQFLHIGH